MATSSDIIHDYLTTLENAEKKPLSAQEIQEQFLNALLSSQSNTGDFYTPLSYYLNLIETTRSFLFQYMELSEKTELERQLRIAYLLVLAEHQKQIALNVYEHYSEYPAAIARCAALLDKLNPEFQKLPSAQHYLVPEKPLRFLGLSFGSEALEWMDLQTINLRQKLTELNQKRLYWIWGSSLLKTLLELTPDTVFNDTNNKSLAYLIDPYSSMLSWTLYYFRFSINLNLLIKHTISGPWMTEEESKIPWTERFLTQWDQRKFNLLNDSIWGVANMACAFWLNAEKGLGAWGDFITIGLLLFDLCLAIWAFEEAKTKHYAEARQFDETIAKMYHKIQALREKPDTNNKSILIVQTQLADLEKARRRCLKNWEFDKAAFLNELTYSVQLLIAFTLLTMPFITLPAMTLLAITTVGAVLCLFVTVVYNTKAAKIDIAKITSLQEETHEARSLKLSCFRDLKDCEEPDVENQRKGLFLEILQLKAETHYQQEVILLQTMHMYRKALLESLVPLVLYASLTCFPLGIGLGIIGSLILVIGASKAMIDNYYTPEKPINPDALIFPEEEYQDFCNDPHTWNNNTTAKQLAFFQKPPKQPNEPTGDTPAIDLPST